MHPPLSNALRAGWNGLSLYVLGPGVGECQVLLLPDGKVVVVDACMRDDRNLGVELLRALGVAGVDLFVVTHPDQDHVRGAAELLDAFPPGRVWMYPEHASLRTVLVRAKRHAAALKIPVTNALRDLTHFAEALDRYHETAPRRVEAIRGTREPWRFAGMPYKIKPIAPTDDDERGAADAFRDLRAMPERKGAEFVAWMEDFFRDGKRPKDHPNQLSIALSVEFHHRRILLGGDVERGEATEGRGWAGIHLSLGDPSRNQLHLLRALDAVKIAHHGSCGAIHEQTWQEHIGGRSVPWGVIAPFRRQEEKLPRVDGLSKLREFAPRLAITHTAPDTRTAAASAGWTEDTTIIRQAEDFPMVALRVPQAGPVEVSVWGDASVWRP